jgi:hypothetical protein
MSLNNYKKEKSVLDDWEKFIQQNEEKKTDEISQEKKEDEPSKSPCDALLSQLYHDWPVCMSCGYPSNMSTYKGFFRYKKSKFIKYQCPSCSKKQKFHPSWIHEDCPPKSHCLLPITLGNLEKEYINWACNPEKISGVHLITWPDQFVRFSPILSYSVFKNGRTHKKIKIVIHISPKSPSVSEDKIEEYTEGNIQSSLIIPPSITLGYLHICEPEIESLKVCPLDKRFFITSNRGGILQTKIIDFCSGFSDWIPKKIFYVLTNEKFPLTGFDLNYMIEKVSLDKNQVDFLIIIDNLCAYIQESKIAGTADFIQSCLNQDIPLIGFIPRSGLRSKLYEFITILNSHSKNLFTHTIDTKERITYLGENNYFLRVKDNKYVCPYSTYWEVANKWDLKYVL